MPVKSQGSIMQTGCCQNVSHGDCVRTTDTGRRRVRATCCLKLGPCSTKLCVRAIGADFVQVCGAMGEYPFCGSQLCLEWAQTKIGFATNIKVERWREALLWTYLVANMGSLTPTGVLAHDARVILKDLVRFARPQGSLPRRNTTMHAVDNLRLADEPELLQAQLLFSSS